MTKGTTEVPVLVVFRLDLAEGPHTLLCPRHSIYQSSRPMLIVCGICPDLHFADNSFRIAATTILYCFEIRKAKNEDGMEIEPVVGFDGFVRSILKI